MLKFKVKGKVFEINYKNLDFDIAGESCDADDVEVTCNGKVTTSFGESFAGHVYDSADVLQAAIIAYINNDTTYQFIAVPDEVKYIKKSFSKTALKANGRDIPEKVLTAYMSPCELQMVTKSGQAAYAGINDDSCILTYPDGSVATDMENFFMEGVLDLYKEEEIVYISSGFKSYLEELLDESYLVKSAVNKILEGHSVREVLIK